MLWMLVLLLSAEAKQQGGGPLPARGDVPWRGAHAEPELDDEHSTDGRIADSEARALSGNPRPDPGAISAGLAAPPRAGRPAVQLRRCY